MNEQEKEKHQEAIPLELINQLIVSQAKQPTKPISSSHIGRALSQHWHHQRHHQQPPKERYNFNLFSILSPRRQKSSQTAGITVKYSSLSLWLCSRAQSQVADIELTFRQCTTTCQRIPIAKVCSPSVWQCRPLLLRCLYCKYLQFPII